MIRRPGLPLLGSLRGIAMFEAAKGLVVLALGFGLLSTLGKDVEDSAEDLVLGLHLNPEGRLARIFIRAAAAASGTEIWMLAALALAYAMLRFAEAYGLWHARRWGQWVAVASGAIYLPFELYELSVHVSGLKIAAVCANLAIIAYMVLLLRWQRSAEGSSLKGDPS